MSYTELLDHGFTLYRTKSTNQGTNNLDVTFQAEL